MDDSNDSGQLVYGFQPAKNELSRYLSLFCDIHTYMHTYRNVKAKARTHYHYGSKVPLGMLPYTMSSCITLLLYPVTLE
jgi:hypothetical protein